jgi:hypothetical protein
MSTILSLPPIDIAERAAAILAVNAAGDRGRINSINKASFLLAKGAVEIASAFDGVLVTSATRTGTVHRVSALHGCSCEAAVSGKACWHACVLEILEESGRFTLPRLETAPLGKPMAERIATARSERYTRALAEMDELFA